MADLITNDNYLSTLEHLIDTRQPNDAYIDLLFEYTNHLDDIQEDA
jgi:hypothetical protein